MLPDLATCGTGASSRSRRWSTARWPWASAASGRSGGTTTATYGVLAAIMAPLVVSVHSVVGLDFAGGATPGWHSTQYPPFFVFGASCRGFAAVLLLVLRCAGCCGSQAYITGRHVDVLGRLLLVSSLCVGYCLPDGRVRRVYGGEPAVRR